MKKQLTLLFTLLIVSPTLFSQECQNPVQVCFNNPIDTLSTENAAPGSSAFCFTPDNSVYFSITTNSNGGDIQIAIDNLSCLDTLPNGDPLFPGIEAVLYEANSQNLCDELNYNELFCSGPSSTDITINYTGLQPATTYYVMVDGATDAVGSQGAGQCSFNIEATGEAIENEFDAGPDFEIDLGESVYLQATGYGDNLSWEPLTGLISDSDIPNPLVIPSNTTTYTLTNMIDGCLVSDSATVTVIPKVIPYNVFTPNDDGSHDTWNIALIERYPKADIRVYSRWGQNVFKSIGYNTPWDGTFNNSRLPAATYYYVIQLNDSRFTEEDNIVAGSVAIVY